MKKTWGLNPQSGGMKIPIDLHLKIIQQIKDFEKSRSWYPRLRLNIRFKTQFCYIDLVEKDDSISPLCRLRYFNNSGWSLGFFSWSSERYEPCIFKSGDWFGSIEDAIKICEFLHLH